MVRREAETEKRRGAEGIGTALSYVQSFSCPGEREREREGAGVGVGALTPGLQCERGCAVGILRVGPLSVAKNLGLSPLCPEFLGLTPRF